MPNPDPVIAALDQDIARLTAELAQARQLKSYWLGRQRAEPKPEAEKRKTVKDWIKEALASGHRYRGADLARLMLDMGWPTESANPAIVVRNTVRQMADIGEVSEEGGEYFLPGI